MTSADSSSVDQQFLKNAMASFLQIGAVVVLLYWCLTIVSPFLTIVIWGLIISIALYPAHVSLSARLGGREKTSATLLVLVGIAIIAVPMWLLADSTIGSLQHIAAELKDGTAEVPPPADSVAEWPVIGDKVHEVWTAAATNLEATLNKFAPQLRSAGQKALAFAGHTVGTAFQFVFSVIIAGVLLMSASGGYTTSRNIRRLPICLSSRSAAWSRACWGLRSSRPSCQPSGCWSPACPLRDSGLASYWCLPSSSYHP